MKNQTIEKSKETTTKSRQLADLLAKKEAAWESRERSGEPLLSNGPFSKAWLKCSQAHENFQATFVVYRGREIDAVVVAEQDGSLTIRPFSYIEAAERLYRATDGTYYLWQKKWQERATVRKLTLEGALLWAVVRVNIQDVGLRDDVVALFKKGGAR